jgi:hypothetical protein
LNENRASPKKTTQTASQLWLLNERQYNQPGQEVLHGLWFLTTWGFMTIIESIKIYGEIIRNGFRSENEFHYKFFFILGKNHPKKLHKNSGFCSIFLLKRELKIDRRQVNMEADLEFFVQRVNAKPKVSLYNYKGHQHWMQASDSFE